MVHSPYKCPHTILVLLCIAVLVSALIVLPRDANAAEEPDFTGKSSLDDVYNAGSDCGTASGFIPLACFRDSARLSATYSSGDLKGFMNSLFSGAIALGGIIAVLRLAWAGFVYMGTDMWGKKEHAKEVITDTLLGLFLLLAIWVILNQINPDILKLNVTFQGASTPSTGTLSVVPTTSATPSSGCTTTVDGATVEIPCP